MNESDLFLTAIDCGRPKGRPYTFVLWCVYYL